MREEKFIEKLLTDEFGENFVKSYPSWYEGEKRLIKKAMKYLNWSMFFWGVVVGELTIYLIYTFFIK